MTISQIVNWCQLNQQSVNQSAMPVLLHDDFIENEDYSVRTDMGNIKYIVVYSYYVQYVACAA